MFTRSTVDATLRGFTAPLSARVSATSCAPTVREERTYGHVGNLDIQKPQSLTW